MNKEKVKKISNIVLNVLMYIFLAICIFAMVFTIFSKKDADGAATLFGYQMRIVETPSMAKNPETDVSGFKIKSIPKNSMIFVETVPDDPAEAETWYGELREGDVLTFRYVYATQVTITHRITKITDLTAQGKGYIIELAGDNKSENSDQMEQTIYTAETNSMNYVIGKVTGQSKILGFVLSLLKNPFGIIFIVIIPCFIIILLEVLKIVGVLTANKKKREQEINQKKDSELEELRQRLAQLEKLTKSADEKTDSKEEPSEKEVEKEEITEKTDEAKKESRDGEVSEDAEEKKEETEEEDSKKSDDKPDTEE